MSIIYLILLAIIQGVTEFLPVSSSGHLVLFPILTGAQDQGLALDVAVHVGTLVAVVIYFHRDVAKGLVGLVHLTTGRRDTRNARLALHLVVASVPVCLAGAFLVFADLTDSLRSIKVIGWAMLGFGVVLWWADQKGGTNKSDQDLTTMDALVIGLWQVLALIPGTSRSGITISGARHLGLDRESAARFSMLLSIPVILASALLLGMKAAQEADMETLRLSAIAAVFACIAALAALGLMMRLLRTVSFTPYVIYRIFFGLGLLGYAYFG